MPTVVICDDHRLFGEALAEVLRARGYDVVACTSDPDEGLAAVAAHRPDVYLTDLRFPGSDGLAALASVPPVPSGTRVLVMSGVGPGPARRLNAAGASGFVCKDVDLDRIVMAIDAVARGEEFFDGVSWDEHDRPDQFADLLRFLTPREREVLRRLVAGQDTASLASDIGVTYSTARTHIQSILAKLGVHSKLEAVALAARHMTATGRSTI